MVSIEGNINDRLRSAQALIERLAPVRQSAAGDHVAMDLTKLRYLGPDGVAMIAGTIIEARQRGVQVEVRPPDGPPPLLAFLAFSGFNHEVLGGAAAEVDHPDNVTVPLRRFVRSRHTDPEPVVQLVSRFEPVSDDLRQSLEIAINECIQNIEDHANSPIGGLGCARFMAQQHEIRVALVDWGDGILCSLRRNHPDTRDDLQALQRVLSGGYSAKTRPNNLGRGIDNLRSVVTDFFGGNLYIVSGNAAADLRGQRPPQYHTLSSGFRGTAVCFTLPVQPRTTEQRAEHD